MASFDDIAEFIRIEMERVKNAEKLKALKRRRAQRTPSLQIPSAGENTAAARDMFEGALPPTTKEPDVVCEMKETEVIRPDVCMVQDIGVEEQASTFVTNIPFSGSFISKVFRAADECGIADKIRKDESCIPLTAQRELTMEINKRLSQVSTEKTHLDKIHTLLKKHSGSPLFVKLFVHKILDQGRLQVTKHPKSYIAYSYIFCTFYSREMMSYFRVRLFTLNAEPLYGVYSTYFGVLKLKQNIKEAYAFIASVTGASPNKFSGEVVEWFLTILGQMLAMKIPVEFSEICRLIEHNVVHAIENRACAERIKSATSSLLGGLSGGVFTEG